MIHKKTNLHFYLIRHAQSEINTKPKIIAGRSDSTPLSLLGTKQAQNLGKYFQKNGTGFDHIYSSPLIRSLQTCEIVLKEMGIPQDKIVKVPELVEFTQGEWEGTNRDKTYTPDNLCYINTKGSFFIPPNGESQVMVEHRVSGWFLDEILNNRQYMGKANTIVIFAHGLVIKCLLHFVMHFDDRLIPRIKLENTGICEIRYNSKGFFIDTLNNTSHLHDHD